MHKFSYKSLFIIFFFLLIGVVVLSRFVLPNKKVSASWWNESWRYRKAISITNNTNFDANNVPYKLNLDTQILITNNKLQADADDIRIVDSEGKIVRYQVEKNTLNTANTKIWFEATVKSNRTSSYYIYYGNSSTTAQSFSSDINTVNSNASSVTVEMKDGFGYTTSTAHGRISDIRKNGSNIGIDGNIHYSTSYPGNWWDDRAFTQTILNSTGPLFVEINYADSNYGSYSSFGSNLKIFNNGFAEMQQFVTYNTSGSENFYYYLPFDSGTRNSVWVNGSGTLVDQDADSGGLTESSLGQNWFGQRWTGTGIYGGTIITKNGSDWNNGYTSTRASYFQTNYSYTVAFTNGSSREVRFGVFVGNGGLSEMQQKGANYGALGSSLTSEEISPAPIAYWKFDEGIGTTTYDSTSNQNNGVFGLGTSIPTWQTESQCINGKCLYFDGGKNYVDFGNNSTLKVEQGNFTVEAWFKSTISKCGAEVVDKAKNLMCGSSTYGGWSLGQRAGKTIFIISDSNTDDYAEAMENVSRVNEWVHAVGVRSGDTISLYINGKFITSTTKSGITIDTDPTIRVGGHTTAAWNAQAFIDEVKIYPYARTADQIKQDYNSRGSSKGSSVNLGVKSSTAPSPRSSLVGHWKFDENNGSTVYDSSGNNKNGTLSSGTSSPSWNNNGHSNKSLSFDGNDSITLANEIVSTSSIRTNGVTYSAWIKANNTSGTQKIVGQKPSSGYSDLASGGIDISSGKARMIAYDDNIAYKYATGNTTLNSDQWYLITGVYDPSDQKIKIYVNGKFDGGETTITTFNRLISNDYNLIGSHNYTSSFFNGLIDEVKIYNRNLTDNEIKQEYNSGSATTFGTTNQTIGGTTTSLEYCIPGDTTYCAPPIAEWNFEENTGTIAKDISGNNLNGSLAGNPTWGSQCHRGSCFTLDRIDNRMTVDHSSILEPTSITIGGWVKLNNIGDRHVVFTKWNGYSIEINSSGYPYFRTYNGSQQDLTSNKNITWGKWHYISATFDDSSKQKNIYLDGVSVGNTIVTNSISYSQGVFAIPYSSGSMASGFVDDVRIYDYARTPAQIVYDYNKGAPIAHWKLDECQGLTAFDSSGSGYTGAISIGPSGSQTSAGTCQVGTSAAWTNGASGKINSSLNFDGSDDYIFISYSNSWKSQNISLSFWLNAKSYTDIETNYASHWFYSPDGFGIAGNSSAWINTSSGRQYLSGCNFNNANKWTHISLTYNQDNGSGQFYVDSKLKCSISLTPGTSIAWNGSSGIYLGGAGDDSYNGPGQMDDVRIYNYALTSEQVKTVYNNGSVNFR